MRKVKGARLGVSFFKTPPGQDLWTFARILLLYLKAKLTLGNRLVSFGLVPIRIEPDTGILKIAIDEGICKKDGSLLNPVFYQYRPAGYIETIMSGLVKIRNLIKMVRRRKMQARTDDE